MTPKLKAIWEILTRDDKEIAKQCETAKQCEISKANTERLVSWVKEVKSNMLKELQENKSANTKTRAYSIDVDSADIRDADLDAVAEAMTDLHNFAKDLDVSLEIRGFSRLPSDYNAYGHGYVGGNAVSVQFDLTQTYALASHPQAKKFNKPEYWARFFSSPKAEKNQSNQTCQL